MGVQNPGVKAAYSSIAKITRPVASEAIPRKRLFKEIEGLRSKPLIWISGPPGCGKTTLVASYLDAQRIPCIWYQIDEGDNDIPTFFYYMGLAAKRAAPRKKKPLPLLTPEYMLGLSTFTLRYFEELYSRLRPPFFIICDNYQDIPDQSIFHNVIADALNVTPKNYNVIIISRKSILQQFVRHQANNMTGSVGSDNILFSHEETREFIKIKGLKLPEETIVQMHEKTQGWAAGIVLMTERLKTAGLDYQTINYTSQQEVFPYFANEVFERIEKEIQRLLLVTAFLPKVTGQMAHELSGNVHAEKILSDLHHDNFFIQNHPLQQQVYQYHPLFRDFLLAKAYEVMSHEEIAETRMKGAKLLEQAGQIEEAFSLLTVEKSWDDCIRLILVNAQSLMEKGRMHTLQEWIQSIPEGIRENVPWLLYWLAVCKQPFNPVESRMLFEKAFHIFEGLKDPAGTLLSWSGVVNSIIHEWDDLKLLDYWIDWLDQQVMNGLTFPSEEIEAMIAASMIGALLWRRPQHPDSRKWIKRALSLALIIRDPSLSVQLCAQAMIYLTSNGDYVESRNALETMKNLSLSFSSNPLIMIVFKYGEAHINSASALTNVQSLKAVNEGLEIAKRSGIHLWDTAFCSQGLVTSLNMQDLQRAGTFLKQLEATVNKTQLNAYSYYLFVKAWYTLLSGKIRDALTIGEKSIGLTAQSGSPTPDISNRIGFIQILWAAGHYEEAYQQLSLAKEINDTLNNPWFKYLCLLTQAQFAMEKGDETACRKFLSKAMEFGQKRGYLSMVLFWIPKVLAKLCRKALDWEIEVEYVQELIRALKLVPDAPPYETENWPYPLKIYTLGRFNLLKEGKPIRFSGKVQHRPLALLKAIIAFGGREVDQNQIIDALWPEAAGDVAYSSFKTAMYRLRQLIGKEEAIQVGESRVTLDPRFCWVDAWAFQRLSGQAEEMRKAYTGGEDKNTKQFLNICEKAIALYRGDFLTSDTMEPWTVSMREKLRDRFIQLVVRLCEHYAGTGQWDKAAVYCRRGLEIDDLAEEFYQRLMTCYMRLGKNTDALSVYQRCCKVLHATMGIEPSPKTIAIYKAITANAKVQN